MPAFRSIAVCTLAVTMTVIAAAQQDNAPGPPPPMTVSQDETPETGPTVTPDTRPLTGAERLTVGSWNEQRNFLTFGTRFFQTLGTNPAGTDGSTDVNAFGSVNWYSTLQHSWSGKMRTALQYNGGASLDESQGGSYGNSHDFTISQIFQSRRLTINVDDSFAYLPESSFGYWGLPYGFSNPLLPGLLPAQSILTTQSRRLSNTVVGQFNYVLTKRSSLTFSGSYGILHFPDADSLNSNQESAQVGYNREISTHNTLGLQYGVNLLHFDGTQNIGRKAVNHTAQVAFGRRIASRLALQLSGGPMISQFDDPQSGHQTVVSWATTGALNYVLRKGGIALSYSHYISNGSGVLTGATTDQVQGSFNRQLSRTFSGSVSAGYAHNTSLQQFSNLPASSSFDSEFVGASMSHPLGHWVNLFFAYNLQHQTTNNAICQGNVCAGDALRHLFSFGLDWHPKPILLH